MYCDTETRDGFITPEKTRLAGIRGGYETASTQVTRLAWKWLAAVMFVCHSTLATPSPLPAQQSIDDFREVELRAQIERVLWAHRVWPEQNPQPKPLLDGVVSFDSMRADVARSKSQELALWQRWGVRLTVQELQSEIDRMARESRDPALLAELFHALEDDGKLIAEVLARPALVDRRLRSLIARDDEVTRPVLRRAADALAHADDYCDALGAGAHVERVRYEVGADSGNVPLVPLSRAPDGCPVEAALVRTLTPNEWNRRLPALTAMFMSPRGVLPSGPRAAESPWAEKAGDSQIVPGLHTELSEDDQSFQYRAVAAFVPDKLVEIATVRWPKPTLEEWWATHGAVFDLAELTMPQLDTSTVHVPQITATACTANTWVDLPWSGPAARAGHNAVWTGTELIVWGGTLGGAGTETPSGGRYEPATNSWKPLPLNPGVAIGVTDFTMTWTGTEVIVYGGTRALDGTQTSGARYNPQTNRWTEIVVSTIPGYRRNQTAIWTGTEMILWGGFDGNNLVVNTGWRFNPISSSWTATSTSAGVPVGRARHTAIWTSGKMIVWGGTGAAGPLNDGAAYDPLTDTWIPLNGTGAPAARRNHSAVWTGTEMIVWGGDNGTTNFRTGGRYKPSTSSWTSTSTGTNCPTARTKQTAIWTGSQMIIWGGGTSTGARYSPGTNSWLTMSLVNAPSSGSAIWSGTEMIVWGGGTSYGARYAPLNDLWTPMGGAVVNAPGADWGGSAVWTGTEAILWGTIKAKYFPATNSWSLPNVSGSPGTLHFSSAVWTGTEMILWGTSGAVGGRYNPTSNSWTATATAGAPSARTNQVTVWTGREMIVWGGESLVGAPLDSGARYDPAANAWQLISPLGAPSARWDHVAVWTGSELLIWGGWNTQVRLGDGARYQPALDTWSPLSGTGAPLARQAATAVWTGSSMVVWGGINPIAGAGGYLNDGGVYVPSSDSWTATGTGSGLPWGRHAHSAAWAGDSMMVWGGYGFDFDIAVPRPEPLSSGGVYDSTTGLWTQMARGPGTSVSGLYPFSVWTGSQLFVFGGLYDSVQGLEVSNSGSLYCAPNSCTTPSMTPTVAVTLAVPVVSHVTWSWPSGASSFDVVRGGLQALRSSGGNFTFATQICIAKRVAWQGASDAAVPSPGDGYWYLVRATNCGTGTYDDGTQIDARDAEIAASPNSCP